MMDEDDRDLRGECRAARPLLQERMDRDLDGGERARLDTHLADCADCREFADGLDALRHAFRSLPETPMPDAALDEVWARTVDAVPWWRRWLGFDGDTVAPWRTALAGAAMVVLAGVALWIGLADRVGNDAGPTEEEIARAAAEARSALALASDAVRRSERAAVQQVLQGEVAPALDRVPIRWPGAATERRNGT